MHLDYGFVKCKIISTPTLKGSRHNREIQYHLHANLAVGSNGSTETWDTAINVGTNDADDLLQYKLAFDYSHPILTTLQKAGSGYEELAGQSALPALDFLRSDILSNTGPWRQSDVMDGSLAPEPVATLLRLLQKAQSEKADVYIFGRRYANQGSGIHDIHMNQGSTKGFINDGKTNNNDHNDIWQDGAVLVDFGQPEWAAYFTAFTQQMVPTDNLGNPLQNAHGMQESDDGSLIQ